ncbi:AMP-binding protein [Sporosarcina sp. Marseille-Q4063]|uniref:class I adenylate-forming enzyme family protein n=1 Tax=Sporosarcina sp. Marseille-Q4063 TaxID=2810514 RepID=UPI001BAF0E04|nr:AMP-binding protein [Sporosarcina sp. Marseille-Q4063]QUW21279.1 AMP-binding protein [Sporosarcina sp. Marseille-Q4063]
MNQIGYLIERSAIYYKEKVALIDDEKSITFEEVNERSNALARGLNGLGLKKGDHVAVLFPNSIDFVLADFALIKAGLVRVPINARLSESEIEYILEDVEAKAVIYDNQFEESINRIYKKSRFLKLTISNDSGNKDKITMEKIFSDESKDSFIVETEDADIFQILYTSGTTGKPKGAMINCRSRLVTINNVLVDELDINEEDCMLHMASLSHGSGSKVLPHFIKGALNVLMKKFSAKHFFSAVEKYKVTNTFTVPTILDYLVEYKSHEIYDLSSLKTILYSASPIQNKLLKKSLEFFGPKLKQVYALTEAPNPVLVLSQKDHLLGIEKESILASAGKEVLNVQVRIENEKSEQVKFGEIGEIVIRGENVMTGYWNRPEETRSTIKEGWLYTGDLGYKDVNGYFYIVGRIKDVIISGGYNVYAKEVEDVICQLEGVREAVILGIPNDRWGESVVAFIVIKEDMEINEKRIIEHCEKKLADYKKPRNIYFHKELPKNSNGKIDKNKLKQTILVNN